MPLFLFYDISPNDTDWFVLIERLSQRENIKVLAAIREENWRRTSYLNEKIDFKDIDLIFTQEEAKLFYSNIHQHVFLDFDTSWAQFGGKGPLLEYAYFLNCGEKLKDRLKAQIENIKEQANLGRIEPQSIELLRIIALVSGYEARLNAGKIESLAKLPAPESLLRKLEKEYLLRFSKEHNIIEGFHPVRSRIMAGYLLHDSFASWVEILGKAFPAILEEDLGLFLLYFFSRQKQNEIDEMIHLLNGYSPLKWNTYSGIILSLLWLGIKNYGEKNRYLVDELMENAPHISFMIALDIDIGGVSQDSLDDLLTHISEYNPESGDIIKKCRKRQSNKKEIFYLLKEWLSARNKSPEILASDEDFIGVSKTAFWVGYFKIKPVLLTNVVKNLNQKIKSLDIRIISELLYGFSFYKENIIYSIFKEHEEKIIEEFCRKTGTITLEKTTEKVKVHYLIPLEDDEDRFITSDKKGNNAKSMAIIDILRKLYPFMKYYSTQGYNLGKELHIPDKYADGSYKEIPHTTLHSPYLVGLNGILIGYIQYKYRPSTWMEYINRIMELRTLQLTCCNKLVTGLSKYYKTKQLNVIINKETESIFSKYLKEVNKIPSFPKSSVDEWGFTREDTGKKEISNTSLTQEKRFFLALQKYEEYRINCNNFFNYATFFVNNALKLMLNRFKKIDDKNTVSSINILDVFKYLLSFQKEFSHHFDRKVNKNQLAQLEKKEQKIYSRLFSLWLFFCYQPDRKITNPADFCQRYVLHIFKQRFINSLNKELSTVRNFKFIIKDGSFQAKNALWIIADVINLNDADSFLPVFSGAAIHKAFKNIMKEYDQNEITRLFQFHWYNVCIVFTYKGKIFIRLIKYKYILSLTGKEDLVFLDSLCEKTFFNQELNLSVWDNNQITVISRLYSNYSALRLFLGHILEIIKPAEFEDKDNYIIDKDMLTQYIQEYTAKNISKAFQDLMDAGFDLHELYEQIKNPDDHEFFMNGYTVIFTNWKQYYPDPDQATDGKFECRLDTDIMKEWKKRLDEHFDNVTGAYFFILFDAIKTL